VPFAVLAAAVTGLVVMALWNWLAPAVFGWRLIGFWQALGLVVLSRILFGGSRGWFGRRSHWRHRLAERWQHMTPEEREQFRAGLRSRCHGFEPTPAPPPPSV
jgi:hypothetical protein